MAFLLLIRYALLIAKRRSTVDGSLSALAAVLVLLVGILLIEVAGDAAPRDEIQIALLR